MVAAAGVSWLTFRQARLLIDPVYPWAVITLVYLAASLLGYLETVSLKRNLSDAQKAKYCEIAMQEARHLASLVDDLLETFLHRRGDVVNSFLPQRVEVAWSDGKHKFPVDGDSPALFDRADRHHVRS